MGYDKLLRKELADAEKEFKALDFNTTQKKQQFINELKSGLGAEIKKDPRKVFIKKKTLWEKLKIVFKNIFTKF